MEEILALIILGILGMAIAFAMTFGCVGLITWLLCKIVGYTFAWKLVALFVVIYPVLASLIKHTKNDK